ncbi:MAG: MBL fold metallo-hydrolase, partial [Firmicutes bacterium]|nr:MBL fold metallo-hydrolase [Bacillota bacterium]
MGSIAAAPGIYAVDLKEGGQAYRSMGYVIDAPEITLVETGSALSVQPWLQGLQALGISLASVRHIIVTHAHLDHAGGAGQLMQACPRALLHAHPRAARHLIHPDKLEAGARAVYGDRFDALWGSLQPVPSQRVVMHEDGSHLDLGDHLLTFYDAPGHAKHHFCVIDEPTRSLFSGDTVGIRYDPRYTGWPQVYGFPTTTPIDFQPDVLRQTLDRLERLHPSAVLHTHGGVTKPAEAAFAFTRKGLDIIEEILQEITAQTPLDEVIGRLSAAIARDAAQKGMPAVSLAPLQLDIWLNAQG